MPRLQCEMFGCVIYPESLSYHELLDLEEELLRDLNAMFLENDAQFCNFFQDGDFLRMTCAFLVMNEAQNREFVRNIQSCLRPGLEASTLFVDKNLGVISFYSLDAEKISEQNIHLPEPDQALTGQLCQVYARRLTPGGWIAEGALPGARLGKKAARVSRPKNAEEKKLGSQHHN